MSVNLFDIIFLALLAMFFLLSYLRGAVKELMSLLGLMGGFLAARWYAEAVARQFGPWLPEAEVAGLLAFLLILLVGYLIGVFFGGVTENFQQTPAGGVSRFVGGVIGLGKGLVFSLALYWVIVHYIPPFQDELADSWMGAWLARILNALQEFGVV